MDFEPCFKVYNLVSIRPKSTKLGQMINLNVIFHMMGSVYRLVTIRNSPQFPVEFRNGLLAVKAWREVGGAIKDGYLESTRTEKNIPVIHLHRWYMVTLKSASKKKTRIG